MPDGLILGLWHQDPGKSPGTEQFVHVGSFDLKSQFLLLPMR